MKRLILLVAVICVYTVAIAQNVTIPADNQPASEVFRELMQQTGKNFVYSSDILEGVTVNVDVRNQPLKQVLANMFAGTDIVFKIKGDNVMLRMKTKKAKKTTTQIEKLSVDTLSHTKLLDEVIIMSRLEAPVNETAEIGAKKLTPSDIHKVPTLFGESDVVKALHLQPGIAEGTEGLANMHVHGGNSDENLYMIDNVPIYHINHFGGLFSAFNTEAIRYIDFFKSSVPAKYDGRLSSFLDVRTKNGNTDRCHGAIQLGTSVCAISVDGPINNKTTYSAAIRGTLLNILAAPIIAIANSTNDDEKSGLGYSFIDLNAKVNHRFNNRTNGFVSVYFGDDYIKNSSKISYDSNPNDKTGWFENEKNKYHWGNLLIQAGVNHRISPDITVEFTAAMTRFFSNMKRDDKISDVSYNRTETSHTKQKIDNHINDWILRADFDWMSTENSRIRFGAGYTRHSFMPANTWRRYIYNDAMITIRDSVMSYGANEVNAYIEDEWRINAQWQVNAGTHLSLFHIDGKVNYGLGPRLSVNYRVRNNFALKAAFSRTNQYVHQLSQSYLSLPTDQWIPVTGRFKPQVADKISGGAYWNLKENTYELSIEGYYKRMRNLVEYADEYYLHPPLVQLNSQLTAGRGSAKGIDFKAEKTIGRISGHIAYSLGWADRTFKYKNGGKTFPARFDNRHTINILFSWQMNRKATFNAAWTGHSGNRFTLLSQVWERPTFADNNNLSASKPLPLKGRINNYKLPFYHRLDVSLIYKNRRGYWNFGLYNAYSHLNTVTILRKHDKNYNPVFKELKLLPVIPSFSYTWQF